MPENIDYRQLADALLAQTGVRNKAVSSTPTTTYGQGPGGLFSTPGLARPVFSAMVLPRMGVQSRLTALPSRDTNPIFGLITGVSASIGSEPTGVCDDPPVAGIASLCQHSFSFGRYSRQTPVVDISHVGGFGHGATTNLQLFGDLVMGDQSVPSLPGSVAGSAALNFEMGKTLMEFATAWRRDFARKIYTGTPANNTSGNGYKEFYGFNSLINTGYVDAETSTTCNAADSIVVNAGGLKVESNGVYYVKAITNTYRNLKFRGERAGLNPVNIKLAMRWSLFYQLIEIWPIAYNTYRNVITLDGQQLFNVGTEMTKLRDEMRGDIFAETGQYLLIDGEKVEVILDDGIAETEPATGVFSSSIYFIPFTVLGNMPVTYFEYYDFDAPGAAMEMAAAFSATGMYYTSDGGRFLWHRKPPTNWCVQLISLTVPRLLLLTPYLAARMTNVYCQPFKHEASPFPDEGYFVAGGVQNRNSFAPSFWAQ